MKQRILAIDDEPHMLRLLERIITEKTGYEVQTTGNALEVPNILEKHQFEVVLTDLKMPGMDGLDILKHLREKGRDEAVIIMTAFGSLESALDALKTGVFDYITKPFKKEQIILTVDRAMNWQRQRRFAERVEAVLCREPYDDARAAFERLYVAALAERHGGDTDKMVEASGLTTEFVEKYQSEDTEL